MSFEAFVKYEAGRMLRRCGAVIKEDHFVYASGRHGNAYVNKNAVLDDPEALRSLCDLVMYSFHGIEYDAVVGPESGGIKIADGVSASHASGHGDHRRRVPSYHALKTAEGGFDFRPVAHAALCGLKVLVVEDVLTTGGSCRKVVELIRSVGGQVVGVAAFVNRGGVTAEALGNVPTLVSLAEIQLDSWDERECPLCKSGVPVRTDLGKGKTFVERQQKEKR